MKDNHKLKEDEIWEELYRRIFALIKMNKRTRECSGAIFGLGGGILSIIAAMICNPMALSLTPGNEVHFLKRISFVFFALFLPFMMLGVRFPDLPEEKYFKI